MFSLFFTPEKELPPGTGFPLWGRGHIAALGCCLGCLALLLLLLGHSRPRTQNRWMKILSVSMVVLELGKDLILALNQSFSVGYLPLHLCSISMFLCLYYAFHPDSRSVGQMIYSIALPGALSALLFPNWAVFPLFHFQAIHSFVYHTLLLAFSLFPVVLKGCRPGLGAILPTMVFLVGVAVPVGCFNHLLHTNYMFLRAPSKASPLELLTAVPGQYGYLVAYFLLVLGVVTLVNLPFALWDRHKKKDIQ